MLAIVATIMSQLYQREPNQTLEANCRPASPIVTCWQFQRAFDAQPWLSGGSRSALRSPELLPFQSMDVNQINAYLERAREIIGDRSRDEATYDDAVVGHLVSGMDIKKAIQSANREHPNEALRPGAGEWTDVAARYEYLLEHKAILTRLGIRE